MLLAFYLKPSTDSSKHTTSILFSQRGSDATSAYFFRHPDPSLPTSKNQYAIALYDSYNPEILFGEILLVPQWTQTTLSQEEIRQNGGIPPPPQPILPAEFKIHLYNPDHQVVVRATPGSWNSAPYWEFEMPQESFRKPSNSILDRTQGDPVASELTPKINFRWKKEGKLSKDYVCVLAGKSTNPDGSKRKNREPDITIALFKHQRELTIYEPNLSRVEMEDHKGLELVLLLGIAVIKDVYQASLKEAFNIPDVPKLNSNENPLRRSSTTTKGVVAPKRTTNPSLAHRQANVRTEAIPPSSRRRIENKTSEPLRPSIDPLAQWEIDAETARLKKLVEREEKERRHAELAEAKRVQKLLEAEKKERRRKDAEVDKETERLKKIYGPEQGGSKYVMPSIPERQGRPQQNSAPPLQTPFSRPQSFTGPSSQNRKPHSRSQPFLSVASGGLIGSGSSSPKPDDKKLKGKKSFFGLRSVSDDDPKKLKKKPSTVWS